MHGSDLIDRVLREGERERYRRVGYMRIKRWNCWGCSSAIYQSAGTGDDIVPLPYNIGHRAACDLRVAGAVGRSVVANSLRVDGCMASLVIIRSRRSYEVMCWGKQEAEGHLAFSKTTRWTPDFK